MKKILILGGASVHCKLVSAAKEMGYYTIVADYLKDSPAKGIADEAWLVDVMSVNEIVTRCKKEKVDGVVSGWLDPCQRPYAEICHKLKLPCYATEEQIFKMTDKHAFKKMCIENNVDVIPEYSLEDMENNSIEYPVFVKPVDSRGSRGQTICYNKNDLQNAIEVAESESSNGDIIIEKYIGNTNSFQVTYFMIQGIPYVIRTADGYKGKIEDKLDRVALCSVSPSVYTDAYFDKAHKNVVEMIKNMGLKDGPVMLQGFYDDGIFRFYDPGLRFPGVDYDLVYKKLYDIDVMKMMVSFSVTGEMPKIIIDNQNVHMNGKKAAVLFPTVSAGQISEIKGLDLLNTDHNIISMSWRYKVGDTVKWTYNVNQRLGEINICSDSFEELIKDIKNIQKEIIVTDTRGNNMIYKPFDTDRLQMLNE